MTPEISDAVFREISNAMSPAEAIGEELRIRNQRLPPTQAGSPTGGDVREWMPHGADYTAGIIDGISGDDESDFRTQGLMQEGRGM